jgi:SAM-dependent methyltransferase
VAVSISTFRNPLRIVKEAFHVFFRVNIQISNLIERALPRAFTRSLLSLHELTAAEAMNCQSGQRVVDVGSGHYCPFARHRRSDRRTTLIAIDILESQLLNNEVADIRVAADVCQGMPLNDASVDVIVTRSVLEHLADNETFVRECSRVLRPNGQCIHVMPARYSPFAILNRILPEKVSKALLFYFFPEWKAECGFYAYYRNCYYPRISEILAENGFVIKQITFRYYQSIYYRFFVPLYLVSLVYDLTLWLFDVRALACQILVVAEKSANGRYHCNAVAKSFSQKLLVHWPWHVSALCIEIVDDRPARQRR